jgi:quinol monooxygenase YgiN
LSVVRYGASTGTHTITEDKGTSMHAAVGHVTIDPSRMDEAEKQLNEMVVPTAREAKGFVSGIWTHSPRGKGVGIISFETEQDAQAFVTNMQSMEMPGDSPVTVDSMEMYTVAATA